MSERPYHVPVMVRPVVEHLRPERGGLYFDGTLGAGGHSDAILEAGAGAGARVIAVDRDPAAIAGAREWLARFGERVRIIESNFADAAEELDESLSGALLDLGVSSHQIDSIDRGFTFRPGAPLDMRMNRPGTGTETGTRSARPKTAAVPSVGSVTAADILNTWSEKDIADVFYRYGEERRSRRLAAAVVRRRSEKRFETSDDLVEVIERALGRTGVQDRARLFQALRIAVNAELEALDRALPRLRDLLEPEGVLVVLSYHSLEDRRVKEAFREWSRECVCPPELPVCRCRGRALGAVLTKKPVTAEAGEVAENPRARSAKLRAWRKAA